MLHELNLQFAHFNTDFVIDTFVLGWFSWDFLYLLPFFRSQLLFIMKDG